MPEDSVAMKDRIILVVGNNRKYTYTSTRIFHMMLDYTPLARPINQSDDIYKAAIDILDTVELQQPVRLLGVRLTNLQYKVGQLPLFPQERRKALMVRAMDAVNNRYGDDTVTFASLMEQQTVLDDRTQCLA